MNCDICLMPAPVDGNGGYRHAECVAFAQQLCDCGHTREEHGAWSDSWGEPNECNKCSCARFLLALYACACNRALGGHEADCPDGAA